MSFQAGLSTTESMAENQIAARYPGAEVRILSMTFK